MCQGSSKSCTSSLTFWTHKGLKTSFSHLPSIGQATTTTLVAATTAAPAVAATSTPAVDGGEKGFAKQNMAGHFLDTSICFVAFWYDNTETLLAARLVEASTGHVVSDGTVLRVHYLGVQLRCCTYKITMVALIFTIWLFNIAMENHHF